MHTLSLFLCSFFQIHTHTLLLPHFSIFFLRTQIHSLSLPLNLFLSKVPSQFIFLFLSLTHTTHIISLPLFQSHTNTRTLISSFTPINLNFSFLNMFSIHDDSSVFKMASNIGKNVIANRKFVFGLLLIHCKQTLQNIRKQSM